MQTILIGRGRRVERIDDAAWRAHVGSSGAGTATPFMTREHHRLRNWAVRTLPSAGGRGLDLAHAASSLGLSTGRLETLAADLERHLFFIVRRRGRVTWAFPVTVERTAHRIALSSGERVFGA